jgi:hypothetical protein
MVGKKLKRRLEELEKRAESASASSPPRPAGLQHQQYQKESVQKYKRSPEIQSSPRILQNNLFEPLLEPEGSSIPPLSAYHTYPSHSQQPYHLVSHVGDQYGDYPAVVPSMMQAIKRDTMNPLNMSYQGFPAIDLHISHGYEDHVNTILSQCQQ